VLGSGSSRPRSVAPPRAADHRSLKLGTCGEHGGDPDSIALFHLAGLDYVSCSPYRVPIARVAAAQAALRSGRNHGWEHTPDTDGSPALVADRV
jgi:PEP-utilising enzyme, PEP-binding domain